MTMTHPHTNAESRQQARRRFRQAVNSRRENGAKISVFFPTIRLCYIVLSSLKTPLATTAHIYQRDLRTQARLVIQEWRKKDAAAKNRARAQARHRAITPGGLPPKPISPGGAAFDAKGRTKVMGGAIVCTMPCLHTRSHKKSRLNESLGESVVGLTLCAPTPPPPTAARPPRPPAQQRSQRPCTATATCRQERAPR